MVGIDLCTYLCEDHGETRYEYPNGVHDGNDPTQVVNKIWYNLYYNENYSTPQWYTYRPMHPLVTVNFLTAQGFFSSGTKSYA